MAIDTAKVQGRRELRFESPDEIFAEAERLTAAKSVKMLGNFTLGQMLGHLANGQLISLDGSDRKAPWFMRIVGWMLKGKVLKRMDAGFQLPKEAATKLIDDASLTVADGLARLRETTRRLKLTDFRHPHPFFGTLTKDEWDRLHCRHAEMHLSFAIPE